MARSFGRTSMRRGPRKRGRASARAQPGRLQHADSLIHLRAEGGGKPIVAVLTAGQRHEQIALPELLDRGAVKRPGPGRPRLRPKRLAGDKGYSSPPVRRRLRQRGIRPIIPTRRNERRCPGFDRVIYRERNRVERLINRLKQCRAIATRYDKLSEAYHALLTIAFILLWL
jgi:transposase